MTCNMKTHRLSLILPNTNAANEDSTLASRSHYVLVSLSTSYMTMASLFAFWGVKNELIRFISVMPSGCFDDALDAPLRTVFPVVLAYDDVVAVLEDAEPGVFLR